MIVNNIESVDAAAGLGAEVLSCLKQIWSSAAAARRGQTVAGDDSRQWDCLVIDALGLGLEPTMQFLFVNAPTFEQFEPWVAERASGSSARQISRLKSVVSQAPYAPLVQNWLTEIQLTEPVLSEDDMRFWDDNGYVVLHNAAPANQLAVAEQAIWEHLGAQPDLPDSWYQNRENRIMVQLFQHPAFSAIRSSLRIHKAFAQLWGTVDLWMTTDRCGFNAPEREGWRFPGPDLHWDVDLSQPIPFATQGILYLTDTPPEQGALTVVPGFHHRVADWLATLPPGCDPQQQDLHALGSQPIGGQAGDLIIWHQALPHGSRPNVGQRPRIVQYINMYPTPTGSRSYY